VSAPALPIAAAPAPGPQDEDSHNPEVIALLRTGRAHLDQREYDAAIQAFQKALDIEKDNSVIYGDIGLALLGKGDDQGAIVSFRKSLSMDPAAAKEMQPLFRAMFETKDYDAAWAEIKRLQANGMPMEPEILRKLQRDSGRTE
jgi:Flp pilus assembly protein TadD